MSKERLYIRGHSGRSVFRSERVWTLGRGASYLGKEGEELAVRFLEGNGYRILARNYRTKLGEIDIIASDKGVICFIEVKTRRFERFGLPQESVTLPKQRQITKAALSYLKENRFLNKKARFDIVSVEYSGTKPKLCLIRNAFEAAAGYSY